jgi:hypothetical protein
MRYFSSVLSGVMVSRWVMCVRASCTQRVLFSLSSVQKIFADSIDFFMIGWLS